MTIRVLALSVALTLFILLISFTPTPAQVSTSRTPKIDAPTMDIGPFVNDWEPKTGSVNSIIELRGYRLYPHDSERVKIFFVQNSVELPARSRSGSSVANDELNGAQTLQVIVPESASLGSGQFVVEANGRRSIAATVLIAEWKAPMVKGITPTSGPPGTLLWIDCEGFHADDHVEIIDLEGNQLGLGGGGSSHCTAIGVPEDAPDGIYTVRLGNKKYGKGQFSESFTFTVTNDPLPLALVISWMTSVAPGQWLDLQVSSAAPLKHSERTEVAFKQAGRTIIVSAPKPSDPHIEVPGVLSPGEVQLQARTWRGDRPSQWSEPVVFKLAEKPVAPSVSSIRLEEGSWVQLWPGLDRANSLSVSAGDTVVINGQWHVADASKLKFRLVQPGVVITLSGTELNEKADWFGELRVLLPKTLDVGDWRMIVSSESDGTYSEVPLVIKVQP